MDSRTALYWSRFLKDAAEQVGIVEAVLSEQMDANEYLSCASALAHVHGLIATMRIALIEGEHTTTEDLPF